MIIVITGASSGFGKLTADALREAGHTVYAGTRHEPGPGEIRLDVQSQPSVDAAVDRVLAEQGHIDVLIHNAGHMSLGPAEAFTTEQLAELYDVNVLGTQRVNRAALPSMREQGHGLLVWVGSASTRGGRVPFLGPYFAAKAGMDTLAESYARELIKFGIETTMVLPGAFPSGTNHFTHATKPADTECAAAYDEPYGEVRDKIFRNLAGLFPQGRSASEVADEIVRVIGLPPGSRPFRTHIDPIHDGSEVVTLVYDRIQQEMSYRIGIEELLSPDQRRPETPSGTATPS
ncbi:SDR family oxidoreductase [Streptomyces shenzhenensis]|uniref:SDR family oxidoreductase n=1 Tax=Streptomyces shenzhenensis TaxID=943815 RepID=UPI0033E99271